MSAKFVTINNAVYLCILYNNNSLILESDISTAFGKFAKNITTNIMLGSNNTIVLKEPEQYDMDYIAQCYGDAIEFDKETKYHCYAYIDTLDDVKAYKRVAKALNITFEDCYSNEEAKYICSSYFISMDLDSIELGFTDVKTANLIMKKICNALEIDIDDYPITDSCGNIIEDLPNIELTIENILPHQTNIPQDNINLCFVGGVSTGKSTILNAIFCEQLTQCKIKRTTMVPTIYIENPNDKNPFESSANAEEIYTMISEKNKAIIEKTENGHKLTKEEYSELVFNVGKLDINILPDSFVNVYDVPGLNDARTKDVYYEYLESNFHKFNLVIFLVDIHSGLNTSDEIDIVNFITNNTRDQLRTNNRKINTLVIVNKADDMQFNDDTGHLVLTGELSEMYDQVEKTIMDEFTKKGVADQLIGILPLCAIDAYLYRMVQKHGAGFKLSPEQILKIGINENGKKFSTLKPAVQEEKVQEILNDANFIETMIKLSGFKKLEELLHKFLNENDRGKQMRVDNLLYDLRKLPSLRTLSRGAWFSQEFIDTVVTTVDYHNKIQHIDVNMYQSLQQELHEFIQHLLQDKVINWFGSKEELLSKYECFSKLISDWFCVKPSYSGYFVDKIIDIISSDFEKIITLDTLCSNFNFLIKFGAFTNKNISKLIIVILSNVHCEKTIQFTGSLTNLLLLLRELDGINVKLSDFLRFIIINQYYDGYSQEALAQKKMLYLKHGEVVIYSFLLEQRASASPLLYTKGLNACDCELDLFYLNYEKEHCINSFV